MTVPTLDDYRAATIDDLGEWLRSGRCRAQDLAQFALAALERDAEPLNAVVTLTPERAQAEAAAVDAAIAAGQPWGGPLHGIPYGVKDMLATAGGIPTTWGAAPLRDQQFEEDANLLRFLGASGAVLVAKLAMVELAGGGGYRQPNASLTGPGRNPWNPERWTGGSSSGSGAAVACGAVPFAIGSETRGSILGPAAYCGVVGVRPTYGLVSRHGAMALSWSMDKLGPMARTVADCARVLEVIGVPDPADSTSSGRRFRYRPERFADRRLRFGLLTAETEAADPEVRAAIDGLLPLLEQLGEVREVTLPDFPYGDVARLTIASEAASFFEDFIESGKLAELTAPEDRVIPYSYETILAKDYLRAQRVRGRIARLLAEIFTTVDLLVAPTMGQTAPPIDRPWTTAATRDSGANLNTASNLAGLPAISLPVELDSRGLPIGVQLVAGAFQDEALLAAAARLEARIGWTQRPPAPTGKLA